MKAALQLWLCVQRQRSKEFATVAQALCVGHWVRGGGGWAGETMPIYYAVWRDGGRNGALGTGRVFYGCRAIMVAGALADGAEEQSDDGWARKSHHSLRETWGCGRAS